MRPVVSDAGPLHYLLLIGAVELLPGMFGQVSIPEAVAAELSHPATPATVRAWLDAAPAWLDRRSVSGWPDLSVGKRGAGERAAIALARSMDARLLLVDDRGADAAARTQGLTTTGTLGVLVRASRLGHVDLRTALARLRETNFRCRPELLDAVLVRYAGAA